MNRILRIGTRDSRLAMWQATLVKDELEKAGIISELVPIKSDGDIDLITPLYAMGVQGVFTKALDSVLLNNRIDIAVHSMKDVPTQLAHGIVQAAVLKRASHKDLFVYKTDTDFLNDSESMAVIATSSIRRKAQWLHRYPNHTIENLRGNVITRLKKVADSNWKGAIFAAAGLERIDERPANAIELDWMLPAPAQGAIMVVCREEDMDAKEKCAFLNDSYTALCVKTERDFLKTLMGGCSTPISALAEIKNEMFYFKGSIHSLDGKNVIVAETECSLDAAATTGISLGKEVLNKGGLNIVEAIKNATE
jgi:hydroxymethylbilane synthase